MLFGLCKIEFTEKFYTDCAIAFPLMYIQFLSFKREGEREREIYPTLYTHRITRNPFFHTFFHHTFDRLSFYEGAIFRRLSVYDDLIATFSHDDTNHVPRSHPRSCRISEPTTRQEFDSHRSILHVS